MQSTMPQVLRKVAQYEVQVAVGGTIKKTTVGTMEETRGLEKIRNWRGIICWDRSC